MERRNPRGSCNDHELALVKAAAWAWFQHGSGSESVDDKKIVPEIDLRRTCHAPRRPSRYKLEAMKMANLDDNKRGVEFEGLKSPRFVRSASNNKFSLLDTYEIESISRKLDQLIESSGDKDKLYKGFLVGDHVLGTNSKIKRGPGGRGSYSDLEYKDKRSLQLKLQAPNLIKDGRRHESVSPIDGNTNIKGRMKKNKNYRGFWYRNINTAVCGRSEDVLNTNTYVVNRRTSPVGKGCIRAGG